MSNVVLRRSTRLGASLHASHRVRSFVSVQDSAIQDSADNADSEDNPKPAKRARKSKSSLRGAAETPSEDVQPETVNKNSRKRSKASVAEPVPTDFAPRAQVLWKIGPHVSAASGVENAILNAAKVGANAFALFLKSQHKWSSSALTPESAALFQSRLKVFGYSPAHVLLHGSYLINLGNPDHQKREKSFQCFLDDLKRCEQLGLHLYNFHPGSTVGQATTEESIALIAACVNRAHKETKSVVTVLENMAGSGNVIGSCFSELGGIIAQVEDKGRVGVCLDTCHMFAVGYDIRTKERWDATMAEFEREVGLQYLRGMHINDSKVALGSKRDRHENIGIGQLSLQTFAHILADPRTQDLPLILETPAFDTPGSCVLGATGGMDVWQTEVAVLNHFASTSATQDDAGSAPEPSEERLREWAEEIRAAVKKASAAKDVRGKKKNEGGRRLGKRKAEEEAEEEVEAGESCGETHKR
ncbi:AP endonuclease [Wolfiporia cocos MD-104 SS10]|uniref:Apurinic-apyrimidinic endonuclease 1 n=1 Tax=Wolfiporia cocos (strain MD-104) TaxID=742152 RepID=A0A2H3J5Z7_WOLCO|nr:AP endonuclease [Wolfiporia cocos MD-104 SS10]